MSILNIQKDHSRFRQIVRGKIKQNLRKYITKGELMGRKGKDVVSVPVPQIEIPRFRFGSQQQGGVGQGDGDVGDQVQPGDPEDGEPGKAGKDAGDHSLEVDVPIEELAAILGEELELPKIEPRGLDKLQTTRDRYVGIRSVGPESLRHFRRTYKAAMLRQIASGIYNPSNPLVIPVRDDKRYRSWRSEPIPHSAAVIIYMMDVSGSMGDEQKEIVRIESFWIDTWLRSQYDGIESRYIIHDAVAREVDRETFFHTRESGGTMISSAYKLCADIIDNEYPVEAWNIYPFHFSDGDNWSVDDTLECVKVLKERVLPKANVFCYGQVESPYGSGQFIKDVREHFGKDDAVITSEIKNKEGIVQSIKDFLGKGK